MMDKKQLFSFSQITVTPTGEELEAAFSQEPLKTAENRLANSSWYKKAVEECMEDYATELALVGGYLDWGVMKLNIEEYMYLSINVIRSNCLSIAFQEFIKNGANIREVCKSLIENKDFVLNTIENLSETLREQARQITIEMIGDYHWFCENVEAYVN